MGFGVFGVSGFFVVSASGLVDIISRSFRVAYELAADGDSLSDIPKLTTDRDIFFFPRPASRAPLSPRARARGARARGTTCTWTQTVRHRWRHAGDAFPRHHGVRVTLVDARAPAPPAPRRSRSLTMPFFISLSTQTTPRRKTPAPLLRSSRDPPAAARS